METLEHTASIVWKAIQLGNVNVLPEHERDRLMDLRKKFSMQGPIATCDSNPMLKSESQSGAGKESRSSRNNDISEQDIKEITEKVLARLRQG